MGSEELEKFYDVLEQFSLSFDEVPPTIEKIAIYKIRIDRKFFNPGVSRYIWDKIEEVIGKSNKLSVINIPELKTVRVFVTNERLRILSTVTDLEELWSFGKRYGIDAYLEGNCTITKEGDILLNLKMIKNKTGEIIWANSFTSGPIKKKSVFQPIKVMGGFFVRFLPVSVYTQIIDPVTENLTDELTSFESLLGQFRLSLHICEATTVMQRVLFGINGAASIITTTKKSVKDSLAEKIGPLFSVEGGLSITGIILPKKNANYGYWLGVYVGGNVMYVLSPPTPVINFSAGIRSHLTRRFSFGGGIKQSIYNKYLSESKKNFSIEMKKVSYEIQTFLNF
jgi:hypothetical protein